VDLYLKYKQLIMKQPSPQPKPAKLCYGHVGGKLGELLTMAYIEKGWIARNGPGDKHLYITPAGEKAFSKMGIDLSAIKA
jgi:Mn-containing catalase